MTLDQVLAQSRNYISFAMGSATTFGILSVTQAADIQTDVSHIVNGVKEIAIGAGPLITLGMGWWASHRSSPAAQVATVSAMPEVKAITVSDPALATAARVADVGTAVTLAPPTVITPKGAAA